MVLCRRGLGFFCSHASAKWELLKRGGYFEAAEYQVFLTKKPNYAHQALTEKTVLKKFLQPTIKISLTPNPETNFFQFLNAYKKLQPSRLALSKTSIERAHNSKENKKIMKVSIAWWLKIITLKVFLQGTIEFLQRTIKRRTFSAKNLTK